MEADNGWAVAWRAAAGVFAGLLGGLVLGWAGLAVVAATNPSPQGERQEAGAPGAHREGGQPDRESPGRPDGRPPHGGPGRPGPGDGRR